MTRKQVYEIFAAALNAAGHVARVTEETPRHGFQAEPTYDLVLDEVPLGSRFTVRERRSGGAFDSKRTGKFDVAVRLGGYNTGDSKTHRFPQRGDGTYDTERALLPLRMAQDQNSVADMDDRIKRANREQVELIVDKLGIDRLGMRNPFRIEPSTSTALGVRVTLDVTLDMTEEGCCRLFRALELHGVPVRRPKPQE